MAWYTRKQVAGKFGVSVGTIYRWEKEERTPKPNRLLHNGELRYTEEIVAAIQKFLEQEVPARPPTATQEAPRTAVR